MNFKGRIYILLATMILFVNACKETNNSFANKLIEIFKAKSINKEKIDWSTFESEVIKSSKVSKDSAIITALTLNNNPHSFFLKGKKIIRGHYNENKLKDTCFLFGSINMKEFNNIGYIKINSFGQNPIYNKNASSKQYIEEIIESIKKQDRNDLKGWVIDLRYNSGGDMWPMLISTTPFFSSTVLGYFKEKKKSSTWLLKQNEILLDNDSQNDRHIADKVKYRILNKDAKIAVLINHRTKSAGEAVAIAFKSLKNVKFFGLKTFGFATSNELVYFNRKEVLVITTGYMADLNGKIYPEGINPDVNVCSVSDLHKEIKKWFLD